MGRAVTVEPSFRSGLERKIADQLTAAGVDFSYEGRRIPYVVPARDAKYLPDFEANGIVLEGKGWFETSTERQKYILIRDSNPAIDIRFVFQDANKKIYKGSKTTYAQWADKNGFRWATKGVVPDSWINEMKKDKAE